MPVLAKMWRLIAAAMLLSAASHADDGFTYVVGPVTVTDLGTLGGPHSEANDINDSGNIVGWSRTPAGRHHAFYYSGGVMLDIGGGWGSAYSYAQGLNNSNAVVGYYYGSNGFQAFRWSAGGWVDLNDSTFMPFPPIFIPGESLAESISDSGRIAGWRSLPGGPGIATVWADATFFYDLDVDPWGLGTDALDINVANQVVGHGSGSGSHRWLFTPGVFPSPRVSIPSFVGATGNSVRGINRWGAIVGYTTCCPVPGRRDSWHATYWNGVSTNATDLGVLPTGSRSVAEEINDASFIAGFADRLVPGGGTATPYSGFLYHRDFGMHELPKLPTTTATGECLALALNNINANSRVQVAGACSTGDQYSPMHAVRWDVTIRRRSTCVLGPTPCR